MVAGGQVKGCGLFPAVSQLFSAGAVRASEALPHKGELLTFLG